MKTWQWFITAFAILIAIIGGLSIVLWASDVHRDRGHTITTNSPTPIFVGSGNDECDHKQQIATLQPGSSMRVRRIRYWKDCATADIVLPDGQSGYIVFGVGNVSVHPPLH
jgi:hypothetical protein